MWRILLLNIFCVIIKPVFAPYLILVGIWLFIINKGYKNKIIYKNDYYINFIYSFITSFWMYISPVVYPLSVIPVKWHYAASFNPMVGIIETARQVIFGTSSLEPIYIINGLITTMIMLFLGLMIFNRVEKTFLDTV